MPFATGKRRTRIMVASIAVLLLLGWIDYLTGYEFGFFIFYFIPVSIAAWYGGESRGSPWPAPRPFAGTLRTG